MRMRHIVICGLPRCKIFIPHYLTNGTLYEKIVIEQKMCVLIVSIDIVWNVSHYKKKWARYDKKCVLVVMQSTSHSCNILIKLKFSWHIFEKYLNIKFKGNPSSGNRFVPCGRTDRRDEANRIIFRNFAKTPNTISIWTLFIILLSRATCSI